MIDEYIGDWRAPKIGWKPPLDGIEDRRR